MTGTKVSKSDFDASASMLGYIFQVRYGLLVALKKMREVEDPDDYTLSIEILDDVAFEKNGVPEELLQTKYHGIPGNLTDKSPDIWKTLRVWIESYHKGVISFLNCSLFLITTEISKEGSLASQLSIDPNRRDIKEAIQSLRAITAQTPSKANTESFHLFNSLNRPEQEALATNIYIIDQTETILDIKRHIATNVRGIVSNEHIDAFTTRLEGKWFSTVIETLELDAGGINLGYLVEIINDLREQFLPSNLPADYAEHQLEDFDLVGVHTFLKQIELFGGRERLMKQALLNFYRAYEQRSRWVNDGLLKPGELKKYYRKLEEEWDFQYGIIEAKNRLNSEESKMNFGLELYDYCQKEGALPIRDKFTEPYMARGTIQKLANSLDIGWHPDYIQLLSDNTKSGAA